ncbi:MAG: M48 family metallopeptidase [Syntrophorhabdaceae bacterium]|nr:M48 family metallopeptidase [Syntrophorhabdaceae bacterium]
MLEGVKNTIKGYFFTSKNKNIDPAETFDAIRVKEEKEYYDYLTDALSVDTVLPIINKTENFSNDSLSRFMKGNNIKITNAFGSHILKTCQEVMEYLGISSLPVELYLEIDPICNAYAHYNYNPDEPHYITFTSGLINSFNKEELKFTIGHELGHIIYKHNHISSTACVLFHHNKGEPQGFVYAMYDFWNLLSQLSADRVGLLVVDDFDTAVNAALKLSTGLNMKKANTTSKNYIKIMEEIIVEMNNLNDKQGLSFHPANPIRTKALEVFFFSHARRHLIEKGSYSEDNQLIKETTELLMSSRFKPTGDTIDPEFGFLLSAGYLVLTSDKPWDENKMMCLLDLLSTKFNDPRETLHYAVNNNKIKAIFEDSISKINKDEKINKTSLFSKLIPLALMDRKISDKVVKTLLDMGEILNIPEDKVVEMVYSAIKNHFKPL